MPIKNNLVFVICSIISESKMGSTHTRSKNVLGTSRTSVGLNLKVKKNMLTFKSALLPSKSFLFKTFFVFCLENRIITAVLSYCRHNYRFSRLEPTSVRSKNDWQILKTKVCHHD